MWHGSFQKWRTKDIGKFVFFMNGHTEMLFEDKTVWIGGNKSGRLSKARLYKSFLIKKQIYYFYVFEKYRGTERDLPSTGSLPKCPQQARLSQVEARKPNDSECSTWITGCVYLTYHYCLPTPPTTHPIRKQNWDSNPGPWYGPWVSLHQTSACCTFFLASSSLWG